MILGVMSDTHGNTPMMFSAAHRMVEDHRADVLIHLGDDYCDGELLRGFAPRVLYVPGLWCPEYRRKTVEKGFTLVFNGISVSAAHTFEDIPAKGWRYGIVLTGHTHHAVIERDGRLVHINPGHLKALTNRGERAAYAIIEIGDAEVHAALHEYDGTVRSETRIPKADIAAVA